jgi:RNA polymerase sigma factor (sigma-70 family)
MTNNLLLAGWWQRWNRGFVRYLSRRVRTSVDIEDLAQETYRRPLRARDLREVGNPQAYVLRDARHAAVEWRDLLPHPDSMASLGKEPLMDERRPELELGVSISKKRLEQMLESVSPTMRAVLVLRLRDDRSCGEIAQHLDITARQVTRYLARGYERLRIAMQG